MNKKYSMGIHFVHDDPHADFYYGTLF